MELAGKVAVVTGSGNGIGEAIAKRFAACGATVVVTDVEVEQVARVSAEIGTLGIAADMTVEADVQRVAAQALEEFGRIDIWHSNAGVAGPRQAADLQDERLWQMMWQLHVMSHVYAARAVLPSMLERGDGYLIATSSSTGLSMQLEKVAYTVTKHGSVALSEWLAATYRSRGIKVSCFCPGAMQTRMFAANGFGPGSPAFDNALTPEQVAEIIAEGVREEKFLILTNPGDEKALSDRAEDYDLWLDGAATMFASRVGPTAG